MRGRSATETGELGLGVCSVSYSGDETQVPHLGEEPRSVSASALFSPSCTSPRGAV